MRLYNCSFFVCVFFFFFGGGGRGALSRLSLLTFDEVNYL